MAQQQLLLLEDVDALGKKGEIVTAKPGYIRNYLLPKRLAVVASANTLRKQAKLKEEREKQAIVDRKEAEELAMQIEKTSLEIHVKVDPEGHMYGSVSALDIAHLLAEKSLPVERKFILLNKPLKQTGPHAISFKLKEGVLATCNLQIVPEGVEQTGIENVTAPIVSEEETPSKEETPSEEG